MSAHTTIGRRFGYTALSIAGAVAALTMSNAFAEAVPRTPLATDDQPPVVPFDPGALINAINDYASLLSMLTGGKSVPSGIGVPNTGVPSGIGVPGVVPGANIPSGIGVPGAVVPGTVVPGVVDPGPASPYPLLPGLQ